jgi:hypothetical protein
MGFMKPELWYSQIIWWRPNPRGELAAKRLLHHHQQAFTPATEGDSAKAGG